jgi:hypothetical protein
LLMIRNDGCSEGDKGSGEDCDGDKG